MRDRSLVITLLASLCGTGTAAAGEIRARVVDADTRQPLPARVYLVPEGGGTPLFVEAAEPGGTAVPYAEQWVPMPRSIDRHTTVSAHAFKTTLAPGRYRLTVERGKEYFPGVWTLNVGDEPLEMTLQISRWVEMADRGWYSGETHVHRRLEELPNVVLAEDLNVAFPVTYWTVNAFEAPTTDPSPLRPTPDPAGPRKDVGAGWVRVDGTHVLIPRNTEYEVFSVGGKRHVLGAVFILNHARPFEGGVPPVSKVAERAHAEGALLDLDKHNWPWSFMLVPVAKVDLFELANNSVWRTEFGFRSSLVPPAPFMKVEQDAGGMTERGWLDFGFQTYYALLNCGFRLRPTAGTASGVHPVPLGFGRVYVHLDGKFDAQAWLDGLRAGRSFVTTGPMALATLNGRHPGHEFRVDPKGPKVFRLRGELLSEGPLERVEVVVNGRVAHSVEPDNTRDGNQARRNAVDFDLTVAESSWVVLRAFEPRPGGRVRFAHTAPWYVTVGGEPVRPRAREVAYFVERLRAEVARNEGVLPPPALDEFRQALRYYEGLAPRAVD